MGATPSQVAVRTLRPESGWHYRFVLSRERVREHFWVVPSLLLLGGVLLGVLTAEAERLGVPRRWSSGLPVRDDAADAILAIIGTSTLTFVGVVFTITLVGLQLASSQLSPRVIRTFVRSGVTKTAFGIFLATFAYSIVVLVLESGTTTSAARSRAVTAAFALVAASLIVFVVYLTSTMKLLQVSWVITAVANEIREAVQASYPIEDAYALAPRPDLSRPSGVIRIRSEEGAADRGSLGVLLGIDRGRLVELASKNDCVLELLPRFGEYVPTGGEIVAIHGEGAPAADKVVGCVHLGRARTLFQDPAYGIRQLVDVAAQALSPALNQPTTAVQVIDRLEDVLLRILRRPQPTGCFSDARGVVRLVERRPTWEELVDLSFTEITGYGAAAPQVSRRLLAAYDALTAAAPEQLRAPVQRQQQSLLRQVEALGVADGGMATSADRLGLG